MEKICYVLISESYNLCNLDLMCLHVFRLTEDVPGGYPDKNEVTTPDVIMYIPGTALLNDVRLCFMFNVRSVCCT